MMPKRSIVIGEHKTSVSLEQEFWDEFCNIAQTEGITYSALAERISKRMTGSNLSSAIRVFLFKHVKNH